MMFTLLNKKECKVVYYSSVNQGHFLGQFEPYVLLCNHPSNVQTTLYTCFMALENKIQYWGCAYFIHTTVKSLYIWT